MTESNNATNGGAVAATMTTLLGGVDLTVTKLDGSTETVMVRQLPVKDLPAYLAAFEDELKTVELFCDKPAGWAATLKTESFERILDEGEKLNLDFLARFAARAPRRREKLIPDYKELVNKLLNSALPNSAPASPPERN